MPEGMRTWTADGKLQMTSERLTREHSVHTFEMGGTIGQPGIVDVYPIVSGMVNDGTWLVMPSVSPIFWNGQWRIGKLYEVKVTIHTGYFHAHIVGSKGYYTFQVIRI